MREKSTMVFGNRVFSALILVLLIVSVMAVVGTFLINSINTFYLNSFYEQMQAVFTTDTIRSMQERLPNPARMV